MSGAKGSEARGFDSDLEEWSFYFKAANHFEELERDVASSQPMDQHSETQLAEDKNRAEASLCDQ
eukprot:118833-Amphidinium_carterae.1